MTAPIWVALVVVAVWCYLLWRAFRTENAWDESDEEGANNVR